MSSGTWRRGAGNLARSAANKKRKHQGNKIKKVDWSYRPKHKIKNPNTILGIPVNVLNRMNMTAEQGMEFWNKYKTSELERTFRNRPDLHPYVDGIIALFDAGYLDTYTPLMQTLKIASEKYRQDQWDAMTPKQQRRYLRVQARNKGE